MKKNYSRRDFIGKTSAGLAGAAAISGFAPSVAETGKQTVTAGGGFSYEGSPFAAEVERLPVEEIYDYHKYLSTAPVHIWRRDKYAEKDKNEMSLPDKGWKINYLAGSGVIIENAVDDFRDYLNRSQGITIEKEAKGYIRDWKKYKNCIVVGTKEQLQGCGEELKSPKDYEIRVTPRQILVCGFDERGAMFGLYNLESRMNLREAPMLQKDLKIVRHSLYDTRMTLSWMGWMEWPDNLLRHLVHDGFDAIFASVYANPNGDRTTAETSTDFYARRQYGRKRQDPEKVRDLIKRAARFGVKFYAPIVWQYMGTKESEEGLRNLVRDVVKGFPDIRGYVLLTEGFWYKKWGGGHGADKEYIQEWARNWCDAVGIVKEECHKIDPSIEILPWEYNINFRPDNSDVKRYFIKQLPDGVTPLLTWENGKSFEIDGMKGFLRDYSLNQIGPAEVTDAQIDEANKRNMKVFSKVDTSASWQYGTIPYLPCPYQWYDRYIALEKYGVSGTLESWSSGYKPNLMSSIRSWTCWSNGLSRDELFGAMASSMFGSENRELVLKAWDHFSQAIRYVPDTGPNMGTNGAIGNPLFFRKPPLRGVTFDHGWWDANLQACQTVNPHWPFTISRMVFFPDFSNKTNKAENYARSATGIQVSRDVKLLPVFLKYLKLAIDEMEKGLKFYREAAVKSNEQKHKNAVREVIVAEQMQRMMQSDYAILEFEDLRLQLAREKNAGKFDEILDKMEKVLREEIKRTELSWLAASRDSRLGFQHEQDYVYTPFSLEEKLRLMKETLEKYIPQARSSKSV
ncbi:MAG: twin-arginine translocation signal domain-containing protein [Bacteroidales bacterium]|nr:twin-arginine translocation signal domain-containing protein [Bacteroidales bacterium]